MKLKPRDIVGLFHKTGIQTLIPLAHADGSGNQGIVKRIRFSPSERALSLVVGTDV